MINLGKICHECKGVGTIPASDTNSSPQPCLPCGGTGYEEWGMIDTTDLEDKINDIKEKVDEIKEVVDVL